METGCEVYSLTHLLLNKWWCLALLTQLLSAKVNVKVLKHAAG